MTNLIHRSNTAPGGWIEHVEQEIGIYCDDGTLPEESILNKEFKAMFTACAQRADRPLDTMDHMKDWIGDAGFTNVQYQDYKLPLGPWPKLQVYKDAGRVTARQFKTGIEGWVSRTLWRCCFCIDRLKFR